MAIKVDVVTCQIPLLLSKDAMKRIEMKIDFTNDTVEVLGRKQNLLFTSFEHYCIPIGEAKLILEDSEKRKKVKQVMFLERHQR